MASDVRPLVEVISLLERALVEIIVLDKRQMCNRCQDCETLSECSHMQTCLTCPLSPIGQRAEAALHNARNALRAGP